MATQLPHHLDLTDQDTSIASHKRSFHKNIMPKSKHIKNLFISHTKGGIPHQTYYRLRKEARNLTPHINLWRFSKKPLQDLKILQLSFKSRTKNHAKLISPREFMALRWFPTQYTRSEASHNIKSPIKSTKKKFKKKYLFCCLFLHSLSL